MWPSIHVPESSNEPWTDYTRWRMRDTKDGAHLWDFIHDDEELAKRPQTYADKYWTGQPLVCCLTRYANDTLI